MQNEIWKDVIGYKGLYQVSNLGKVKSLPRNGTTKNGSILIGSDNGYGYIKVLLCNNKKTTKYIHIIVAEAFLNYKPEKGKICVDHINKIKIDNRLENLQIITPRENITRAKNNNTKTTGVYKVRNKFRAIISHKYKSYHLGYFDTIEDAKKAYNNKLKELENEN
jgi:hypothetical protein